MKALYEPYSSTKKYFKKKDLIIRPSRNDDLESLIEIKFNIFKELVPRLSSWYKKHPEAFEAEFYGLSHQDPQRRIFYTIENLEKQTVGCGGVIQKEPKKEPNVGELSDIYLLLEHRGKGLGRTLVEDLIRKAKRLDFESIFLTTRVEFDKAVHLYKKVGFEQIKNKKYGSRNSLAFELNF